MLEHDKVSGRYIMRVDASLYKESDCAKFLYYKLIMGLVSASGVDQKNCAMEYGTAFHKGLELRAQGADLEAQLKAVTTHFSNPAIHFSDREWRTIGNLVTTYVAYDMTYKGPLDSLIPDKVNGVAQVEQKFIFPFYKTDKVEVLLCGTIDMVGRQYGTQVVVDHKTTSSWNVEEYLAEYELSPQLMIYKWVYDQLHGTDVGALVNGIFISQKTPAKFKRSDVIKFSPRQVANCINALHRRVAYTVNAFENLLTEQFNLDALFPPNYCQCSKRFGDKVSVCQFKQLCVQPQSEDERSLMEFAFAQKVYNPMEFGGGL